MNKNLYFLTFLTALMMMGPAFSKTKKVVPKATPLPKVSPNLAAMQKALRFWVY